jgi:dipeptidyl aminopeptidase/acylaminoacyl peptidase
MTSLQGVGDIESVELSSHTVHTLATSLPFSQLRIAGERAVFMTWALPNRGTLSSAPLDGSSAAIKLAEGAQEFQLSKDGSRIIFTTDCTKDTTICKLWTVPTAGGTPQLATSQTQYLEWQLSDDGSRIVFMEPVDASRHGSLQAGTIGQPSRTIASAVAFEGIVADGNAVLFYSDAHSSDDASLSIGFLADGRIAALADGVSMRSLSLAPDGKHAAFLSQSLRLEMASFTGDPALPLIDLPNAEAFLWSSRGALVATHVNTPAPYRFQDGLYVFPR